MMRIDRLAEKPDRAGRYQVRFSDGSSLRLYRQTVEEFGLYTGLELEESQMTSLREQAGEMSAKMRAVRIVTASAVSRRDLEQRLIHRGEDPAQARSAVAWMEELRLVDDRQTARQIVEHCVARGYGAARAKQMLYDKQIPRELWTEALADYPDQREHILRFLRTRLGDAPEQKQIQRAVEALLRRGHSRGEIWEVLRQLTDRDEYGSDF